MSSKQPGLRTERLQLRPFVRADAEEVQRLAGDPAIADTTLRIPHPYRLEHAVTWIEGLQERWASGQEAAWAIEREEDLALIGAIGLERSREHRRAELGYWVGVPYWGKGYCTEAALAVRDAAFEQFDVYRLEAHCMTRNSASARVMEKIGLKPEGVHRGSILKNGRFEDIASYAMLVDDPS